MKAPDFCCWRTPSSRRRWKVAATLIFCAAVKPTNTNGPPSTGSTLNAPSGGAAMTEHDIAWPSAIPARLRGPLAPAAGGSPANVALMHLLMECESRDEAGAALSTMVEALQAADDPD